MNDDFVREAVLRMTADGVLAVKPIADGKLHRCPTAENPKSRNGAYIIHMDDMPVSWWRNWNTGADGSYSGKPEKEMSRAERKAFQKRMEAIREASRAEDEKRQKAAAREAQKQWQAAAPATNEHPYLKRKEVESFGLKVDDMNNLLVPVMNEAGALVSLQKIFPEMPADGSDKRFLPGGQTGGGYFYIPAKGNPTDGVLLIAEGYATAASLHMATGYTALIAFNIGNLKPVAEMARRKYPERQIVICGDYDLANPPKYPDAGGIGKAKAIEAAEAIGAYVAVCPPYEGRDKADFNDLFIDLGAGRVRAEIEAALKAEKIEQKDRLPAGFYFQTKGARPGLWHRPEGEDDSQPQWICSPFSVIGHTRDKTSGNWGLDLEWQDMDGVNHRLAMPYAELTGRDSLAALRPLANGGLKITASAKGKNLLCRFLAEYETARRVRCVPVIGWAGDVFILPERTIGQATSEIVALQADFLDNYEGLYRQGGTFEGWQKLAGLAAGNPMLTFGLAAAFAGPLMKFAGADSGGFNFEGPSSTGKTTILRLANSVLGPDSQKRTWRATANGIEAIAVFHNDNLLCLDELSQIHARELDAVIYFLANGAGKGRANRNGNARKTRQWRLLFLSTGELGLAAKLNEDGKRPRAGQEVRFCALPVDAGHIRALHGFADAGALVSKICELASVNYGHAGPHFLEKLTEADSLPFLKNELRANIGKQAGALCKDYPDAGGQVERVAYRFALVWAAGEMAKQAEILPAELDIAGAVSECFKLWIEARGGAGSGEWRAILEQVRLFIEQHGQSRFQAWDHEDALVVNRAGYRKDDTFYCLPEVFKAEIIKGHNIKLAKEALASAGWLIRNGNSYQANVRLPGLGQKKIYILRLPEETE